MTKSSEEATAPATVGSFPAVPTTKVLAIGYFPAPLTPEQRQAIMRENAASLFHLPAGRESWRMNGAPA